MRAAGLASILLLAGSGSVLGYPQYPSQDSTDGSAAATDGGSVSGEFWWQQGGAFDSTSGNDATNALSNIFNQVVNAFNSTVSQVTSQVTSGINSFTPTQSEYCALGQDCVPWQLCPNGIITQDASVQPGLVPYPPEAGFTGCSDVKGNICCGIPEDVLSQQQQGQSNDGNVYDDCSAGLQCVAIESCNLYNGFIEPQVEQYAGQPYVNYNKCTGSGSGESVCCQPSPSSQQNQGPDYNTDGSSTTSQQTQGSGTYSGDGSSADLNAQCASNQDCVPYFQCYNGEINTDGAGLLDVRTKPKATCSHPEYPDVPAICCRVPGLPEPVVSITPAPPYPVSSVASIREDECTGYKVCVSQGLCDATGNIITDGGGLIDIRIVHKRCYVDGTEEVGVCCTPPGAPTDPTPRPIPQIDACPSQSICIEPGLCLGEAMDSTSSWTAYSPTGTIFSQCSVGGSYSGVCCINPIPQIDACSSQSSCIDPSLCKGEAMDSTSSWTSYSPTGTIFSQCSVGGSYSGVCCINPIPQIDACPSQSSCLDPSLCKGEAMDSTSSWTAYSPTGTIFSQCSVGGSYSGVCCINPIPQIDACPSQSSCMDPSVCKGEAMDSASSWTKYSPTGTIFSQCAVGGSYTGVCCINPIRQVEICPRDAPCIDPGLCKGEALDNDNSWTSYAPSGKIFSQCTVGSGSYSGPGVCCINPIPQIDTCPSQSSCVDPSLCLGEAMDSTSSWTAYSPSGTIFSQCSVGGSYSGVCCINPEPVIADVCPDYDECVPAIQCDQNGNIVTDGSGLIDIRRKTTACWVDDAKYDKGICCTPPKPSSPVINVVDTCPGQSYCVPELLGCTGQALDNGGSMIDYATGGVWSGCNIAGSPTPGICCATPAEVKEIKPCSGSQVCVEQSQCGRDGSVVTDGSGLIDIRGKQQACWIDEAAYTEGVCCNPPAPSLPVVDLCPGTSTCVPDVLCKGEVLDSVGSMIPYAPQGSWSQCPFGGSGALNMGVCCQFPPPEYSTIAPIIAANQCGRRNKEEVLDTRIQSVVATNEAQFGEFPWQAIIFFTNYTFKCGASLIGDRWLVTGGHCVNGLQPSEIQIRLGEWQVNSFDEPKPYVDVPVKGITVHPDFNSKNVQNNVAVIELAEPVEIDYHINSICLPAPGKTFPNQKCIISGWGKDSFEGNYQHILKKVDVPTVDKRTCQALLRKTRLGKWFFLHDSFMCAGGEENKDACKGDGGGPLACEDPETGRYFLAGLTSWGIGCGNKDVPGVYADVQGFSTWIQGVIGGTLAQQQQVVGTEVETNSNPYGK